MTQFSRRGLMVGAAMAVVLGACGEKKEEAAVAPYEVEGVALSQISEDLAAGKTTAVAVTQAYMDRIKMYDGALHCVIGVMPDALAQAAASDARRKEGKAGSWPAWLAGPGLPAMCARPTAMRSMHSMAVAPRRSSRSRRIRRVILRLLSIRAGRRGARPEAGPPAAWDSPAIGWDAPTPGPRDAAWSPRRPSGGTTTMA